MAALNRWRLAAREMPDGDRWRYAAQYGRQGLPGGPSMVEDESDVGSMDPVDAVVLGPDGLVSPSALATGNAASSTRASMIPLATAIQPLLSRLRR